LLLLNMLSAAKILAFACVVRGTVGDASLLHTLPHHGSTHQAPHHGAPHQIDHHIPHHSAPHHSVPHHSAPHHSAVHHGLDHHGVGHNGAHHGEEHHGANYDVGHHGVHHNSPAHYGFDYAVHDEYSGNQFGHSETRDGYKVDGTYYVHLPNGRVQTVNYYADETGYHPTVVYEGTATYHQGGDHHANPHY
ncbi:unnamed protein product, partial [Meganyctiphanes norvegica]